MSYDQIVDILEEVKRFHQKTASFYEQISEKSQKTRVGMLLDYMARREKGFAEIVEKYQKEGNPKIIQQWLQFSPPKTVADTLDRLERKPLTSVDEVMRLASKLDNVLISYYQKLVNMSRKPEVEAAFTNLLETTLQKDRELLFNAQLMKEI